MELFKAIIVDDEPRSVRVLKELLQNFCPEVEVIATANSVGSAHEQLLKTPPDILFLDVEMPIENGFDLLKRIAPFTFDVVLLTAYDGYAIKAIKQGVTDYLLKPVDIEQLRECINKIKVKKQSAKSALTSFPIGTNPQPQPFKLNKVGLPTQNGLLFFDYADIIRFEAKGSYTYVITTSKKSLLISKNLKELEDMLPASLFCRVHHSHLVNISFVTSYTKGRGGEIEMTDGTLIEVSVRKKDDFLNLFK